MVCTSNHIDDFITTLKSPYPPYSRYQSLMNGSHAAELYVLQSIIYAQYRMGR
jgi:hypothetical protein